MKLDALISEKLKLFLENQRLTRENNNLKNVKLSLNSQNRILKKKFNEKNQVLWNYEKGVKFIENENGRAFKIPT